MMFLQFIGQILRYEECLQNWGNASMLQCRVDAERKLIT